MNFFYNLFYKLSKQIIEKYREKSSPKFTETDRPRFRPGFWAGELFIFKCTKIHRSSPWSLFYDGILKQYEEEEKFRQRKIKRQRNIAYVIAAVSLFAAVRNT